MPEQREPRPPSICVCLIRMASWIVPRRERSSWSSRWYSGVRDWWILVERGELSRHASREFKVHCGRAFADAFWRRFSREGLKYWVRAASFPLAVTGLALLLTTALSRGLAATRHLVEVAATWNRYPPPGVREGTLVGHGVMAAFALFTAAVLIGGSRMSIWRRGVRYWLFFILKTASIALAVLLLWIEGGAALRAVLPQPITSALLGGVLLSIVFVAAFALALLWSFDDQRRRCPVCLRRLAMPVSLGSWASMFDPVTTELLCDEGHGSLSVPESDLGEADRWISLDSSWRDLFETPAPNKPR